MARKFRIRSWISHYLVLIVIGVGFVIAGLTLLWVAMLPTPDLSAFQERKVLQSTKIYDRTGEILLYDLNKDVKRSVVALSDISPYIQDATVALEDDTFYSHMGIRPLSFMRAILVNIVSGEFSQGGSTITQQVVKNAVLTPDKEISRKIKEWILAVKLERSYTKEEILSTYLNESPYGGTIYGVEEASRVYFDKNAAEVSLAEAAYLAALPQAPTYYLNNREALDERKDFTLDQMRKLGFITDEEYQRSLTEEVTFQPRATGGIRAPHFVFYVQEELERMYGPTFLEEGGIDVITTLDYELQEQGQEIVTRYATQNAERFNAENASLVAIDPTTGEILTMVGSRDYFDDEIDGSYNAATAERQPGSSFKPFVYAQALREGYTRNSIVFDLPTQFSTACSPTDNYNNEYPCYSPGNYDDTFRGPMRFIDALAQSVNIPAVKVLYLTGVQDAITLATRMGISTLVDPARYGLSLVLGAGEVQLLEMVSSYGVFATEGIRHEPVAIMEIQGEGGEIIYEIEEADPTRVLEESVAREMNYMLSNNAARTPAFGANSPLYFSGYDVAAKTGTTNEYRDAWIIGYTPNISVGAWAGNNDNSAMSKQVAGFIIAPLWNEFMQAALTSREREFFSEAPVIPSDIKPILRGVWNPVATSIIDEADDEDEEIDISTLFEVHSILHYVQKDNPRGPAPANPANDSQYRLWEYPIQQWVAQNFIN